MSAKKSSSSHNPLTLAIDIGGSAIKMMVIDAHAKPVTERTRLPTPDPATPESMMELIRSMLDNHGHFDRISVGFPGVVKNGVVLTAPNLDDSWQQVHLANALESLTKKPARICNDADVQGYADIIGKGVELVITLGTGMGFALYIDGILVPNIEFGHHPFRKDHTYEELLGRYGLHRSGEKKWNKNLARAIDLMMRTFNPDHMYIGGGNTHRITLTLPKHVKISSNLAGLTGGVKLWEVD